ncbi:MAG: iron-containing alcohol dehydrogenase [Burkholderiales bacterium]|nr:iron-containing alcohol dehydrogenase [Burkholderiales bacterium]
MTPFPFNTVRRIVVEQGGSHRLGALALPLVGSADPNPKALVVTDAFLANSGLLKPARQSLLDAGFSVVEFTGVLPDPSEAVVQAAVLQAQLEGIDLVVGIGGGSSLDVAKIVACLALPGTPLKLPDLYGVESVRATRLPLVMVPTTAGTGSEVTSIAIVTTGESTKAGIVNTALLADMVLLDAQLTVGLPPAVTAATGVDAMVHAIEAYTSLHRKNPVSDMLARQALQLLSDNLLRAHADGTDAAAREAMLLGAMLAGQAFENAPVAAVHALAYPLGGIYHIAHGVSNALVLPHVMRFNRSACANLYAELAAVVQPAVQGSVEERCDAFIAHMADLTARTALPQRLRDCGIAADAIDTLATAAMGQQRLLKNNPRPVSLDDARAIYQAAW